MHQYPHPLLGSIANLFSLQGLGITSFLSVVFGFVVFNL